MKTIRLAVTSLAVTALPAGAAVALVMADFLEMPYRDIVIAALVPAILFYVALFILADLEAARAGIPRGEKARIPRLGNVLRRGWAFVLPCVVLVGALFWLNRWPETVALWAALAVAAVGALSGYGSRRLRLRGILDAIRSTGLAVLDIMMIVTAAGFSSSGSCNGRDWASRSPRRSYIWAPATWWRCRCWPGRCASSSAWTCRRRGPKSCSPWPPRAPSSWCPRGRSPGRSGATGRGAAIGAFPTARETFLARPARPA